jgi:AhpD family alkylhydroperoxidase
MFLHMTGSKPVVTQIHNEEGTMPDTLYPSSAGALSDTRKRLTPELHEAFQTFSQKVFASGALTTKTKQLIAVAVAHVTQCPYCIRGHTRAALREGASREELMEAIWVAAEMRAGAAYAHSTLALDEMERAARRVSPTSASSG